MNVIIRLQNLPWSANASDIRQFFKGLQIPEGGVHIVGGEDGDAFIAFSSDEDARQAMSLSGGRIKEVKVTLLLSSRAEMQKVIEKARAASASFMTTKMAQQLPSAEAFTTQFVNKKMPEATVTPTSQTIMANYLQHSATAVTPMMNFQLKPMESSINPQVAAPPIALAANPQIPLYYAMNNPQEYMKYMSMANAGVYQTVGNTNEKKIENNFQILQTQQNTSTDYRRPQMGDGKERQRSRSPISRYDDKKEKRGRRTRFSSPEKTVAPSVVTSVNPLQVQSIGNPLVQQPPPQQIPVKPPVIMPNLMNNLNVNMIPNVGNHTVAPKMSNSIWDVPPMNLNSYSSYQVNSNPIANNYSTSNSHSQYQSNNTNSSSLGKLEIGTCIKVSNIDKETGYADMRKFFAGLPIGNNDIKFLKDDNGDPTGVALIRFLSSDSKKQAMTKNGWQCKSTQLMITSITEDDFENSLDSSRSRSGKDSNSRSYKRSYDDARDSRRDYDRYRERSDSRERNYDSRNRDRDRDYNSRNNMNSYNRNNGNNFQNNRYNNDRYERDRPTNNFGGANRGNNYQNNNQNNFNRRDFRRENEGRHRNFRENNEAEEKIEYIPDENFTVLIIDDIPDKNEADLFQSFPEILGITINKYTAYCKFRTHEAAKAVLENRFLHYIRNKRVFLEKGSELQYDDLVKKYGKFDNPEFANEIAESSSEKKDEDMTENSAEDKESNVSNVEASEEQKRSRDPRQKANNDKPPANSPTTGNLKTDCVLIKNLDPQTTIEDIEKFFAEVNIQKTQMRTHILLDKQGQPCGDCFVEFKFENDIHKAASKNNQELGPNRVQIMPIPREQVEAVLSSFGAGGDDSNRQSQNRGPRDWAPPSDFGSPHCVVMINNLCYRANIEDILDAFSEFDLTADQIIRRYNDFGQPTGNACINFNSPEDAAKACEEYNKIRILNRTIWLRRL